MSNSVSIHNHPLFEKGVFEKHPSLFNAYLRHMPEYLKEKYKKTRKTLPEYEETFTWPMVLGPGFRGATHPGAGKTFNGIMTGSNIPIYNSDCLYVNPSQNVFAISDSPGITTFSRNLFAELDQRLKKKSIDGLETIINALNKELTLDGHATLTLIRFYKKISSNGFDRALGFIAGDTLLFHGNVFQKKFMRIEGSPNFLGSSNNDFKPIQMDISKGDFFVIASDGITSMRAGHPDVRLEDVLFLQVISDPENFAFNVIQECNRIMEEHSSSGSRTLFNGGDDISVILVFPEKLSHTVSENSIILGGYIRN